MNQRTRTEDHGHVPSEKEGRVLLAEDDADLRAALTAELERGGLEVVACRHGMELVAQLDKSIGPAGSKDYDVLVADIRMPGVTGLEVLEGLNALGRPWPVILITAFGDQATHTAARRMGAAVVLDKPFKAGRLLQEVQRAIERTRRWSAAWEKDRTN